SGLISIRRPVAETNEAGLGRRFTPEAKLERRRGALFAAALSPGHGDLEYVTEAADERREESSERGVAGWREIPVAERNDPVCGGRLSGLADAADHERNPNASPAHVDDTTSALPLPWLRGNLFAPHCDVHVSLARGDVVRGRRLDVVPAHPWLRRIVAARAQGDLRSCRRDRRGGFAHRRLRDRDVPTIACLSDADRARPSWSRSSRTGEDEPQQGHSDT